MEQTSREQGWQTEIRWTAEPPLTWLPLSMWFFMCLFPGYSVTTLKDGRTQYFVTGAPRSNHTGQVIVYTLNAQKQTSVIDSERGKQVLAWEDVGTDFSSKVLTGLVLLDRVVLWERPLLSGCGQRRSDRPPAGRGTDVHERAEERGRQGLRLLCHQGNWMSVEKCWLAMPITPAVLYSSI